MLQKVDQNVLVGLSKVAHGLKNYDRQVFPIPPNATSTVYVEGLPEDCAEREVARKFYLSNDPLLFLDIFRPYIGFKGLRLIPRETRDGKKVHFAFADFENVH